MQYPKSLTRLRCCNFAIKVTSVLNSFNPCTEPCESLFTAISWPSVSVPWKYSYISRFYWYQIRWELLFLWSTIYKSFCRFTLYTSPKPPSPSFLMLEKSLVAVAMVARLKNGTSKSSLCPSMFCSIITLFFFFSDKSKMVFTLYRRN